MLGGYFEFLESEEANAKSLWPGRVFTLSAPLRQLLQGFLTSREQLDEDAEAALKELARRATDYLETTYRPLDSISKLSRGHRAGGRWLVKSY